MWGGTKSLTGEMDIHGVPFKWVLTWLFVKSMIILILIVVLITTTTTRIVPTKIKFKILMRIDDIYTEESIFTIPNNTASYHLVNLVTYMPQHATKMLWTYLSTALFSTSRVCFSKNVVGLGFPCSLFVGL